MDCDGLSYRECGGFGRSEAGACGTHGGDKGRGECEVCTARRRP
jgi:hypothetical protein